MFPSKLYGFTLLFLPLLSCANEDLPAPTDTDSDTDSAIVDTSTTSCSAPLVRLQTGQDSTCSGNGNEHLWPLGMAETDCHGWGAEDTSGSTHNNSANTIQCNADGSFSFTQYAGNLDCSGTGTRKTFFQDVCEQDIPPNLYTLGINLSCCTDPTGPDCEVGNPSVTVPGGQVFLNGEACE